jgi:hypothetical protein
MTCTFGSRYDLPSEIATMEKAVSAMPVALRALVESVFCDSKACADYSLWIQGRHALARRVLDAFGAAMIWTNDGYNGVWVWNFDTFGWTLIGDPVIVSNQTHDLTATIGAGSTGPIYRRRFGPITAYLSSSGAEAFARDASFQRQLRCIT